MTSSSSGNCRSDGNRSVIHISAASMPPRAIPAMTPTIVPTTTETVIAASPTAITLPVGVVAATQPYSR
jgi:hypothetical protein